MTSVRHTGFTSSASTALAAAALCGVGAELLSGYGPSTGHVGKVLVDLVFFTALYGAPAVLVREIARRRGWGWPSMLLGFAALGVAQCCLIDQSLFSSDYQGYDGWRELRDGTWLAWPGVPAYAALSFVVGHVIFSFAAPIAVAEAWRAADAHRPWLRWPGIVIAAVAYAATAGMIAADPQSHSASTGQLMAGAVLVVGLCCTATLVGERATPRVVPRRPVDVPVIVAAAMAAAGIIESVPPTWPGVVIYLLAIGVGGGLLWRESTTQWWTFRHTAAIGVGVLLARGILAFLGDPLGGDVAPIAKYLHNIVMLSIVGVAGWFAMRPKATDSAVSSPHCP